MGVGGWGWGWGGWGGVGGGDYCQVNSTHLPLDKMTPISQPIISEVFS